MNSKRRTTPQMLRFVIVGTFNTALSYGIYAMGLWAGLHFAVANFVALLCGIGTGFVLHGRFVFRMQDVRRLPRFVLVWAVLYVVHVALIATAVSWLAWDPYRAGLAVLVPITALSFVLQRSFTFRPVPRR